jgi:hypothetical protein
MLLGFLVVFVFADYFLFVFGCFCFCLLFFAAILLMFSALTLHDNDYGQLKLMQSISKDVRNILHEEKNIKKKN